MTIRSSFGASRIVTGEWDLQIHGDQTRGKLPPAVFCHGATGSATATVSEPERAAYVLIREMAKYFNVVVADFGGPTPWGNSTFITSMEATYAYFVSLGYPSNVKLTMFGESMGVMNCLRYLFMNSSKVASINGLIPCLNLEDMWAFNDPAYPAGGRLGLRPTINAAFPPSYNPSTMNGFYNPVTFASSALADVPIKFYHSQYDTVTPKAQHIDLFMAARSAFPSTTAHEVGTSGYEGHSDLTIFAGINGAIEHARQYAPVV